MRDEGAVFNAKDDKVRTTVGEAMSCIGEDAPRLINIGPKIAKVVQQWQG